MPSSLEDLRGPAAGEVELPLHVAWSGRRVYDVSQEDQRLVLYALLLAEAQREDLERFIHRDSLVSIWPRLRPLLGRTAAGMGAAAHHAGLRVSLDGLPPTHSPESAAGWPAFFERYGLLLAGRYAFRAHEILHRPSQDVDFATRDNTPLPSSSRGVKLPPATRPPGRGDRAA